MGKKLDITHIKDAVLKKYAEVSQSAEGKFNYPTGKKGAQMFGYDLSVIESVTDEILESFCGVGNPFTLGVINVGEAVLDVGCGAGFDLINAAHLTGPTGRVYGIDITPEMVEKALKNLRHCGMDNSQVHVAGSESIPYDERAFDVVISNGVLNLSPFKEKSFQEICRVLRPGGRLQFADIVLKKELPADVASSLEAWSD
jgi:SAM-dependent methyltransferase